MPKQSLEEASPFFAFTYGTIEILPFLHRIFFLPQHLFQLGLSRDECLSMRISGGTYRIVPLEVQAVSHLLIGPDVPFWCFFSNKETFPTVKAFLTSVDHPTLHASTVEDASTIPVEQLEPKHLFALLERVRAFYLARSFQQELKALSVVNEFKYDWPKVTLRAKARLHFCTRPNELTLASLGYNFAGTDLLAKSLTNQRYVRGIVNSTSPIERERRRIIKNVGLVWPPTVDLIVTVPSFLHHLYTANLNFHGQTPRFREVFKSYLKQRDYRTQINSRRMALNNLADPDVRPVVEMYRKEIEAYSAAVTLVACNNFAPVLRLPPAANHLHADLRRLGDCARGKSPHIEFKQNKLYRKISKQLSDVVPKQFRRLINSPDIRIKLIGNAPLEWLPVNKLPLLLRAHVSRIPTTPGNALFGTILPSHECLVPASSLLKVLIIRSFSKGDHMKLLLSTAMEILPKGDDSQLDVRIVDVKDVEELISAVNNFDGGILIFDGHGAPSNRDEPGAILLDGIHVDIWKYKDRIRIPPIVITSACDTHPVDGCHASVANAFLMLGATTVLATVLPINAIASATFIARLLLRIREYIPLATQNARASVRWGHVVDGLQRMTYVTEQLHILKRRHVIEFTPKQWKSVSLKANILINTGDSDWYEKVIRHTARITQVKQRDILKCLSIWGQLPDVIKYVQLGNPEQILIVRKTPSTEDN